MVLASSKLIEPTREEETELHPIRARVKDGRIWMSLEIKATPGRGDFLSVLLKHVVLRRFI